MILGENSQVFYDFSAADTRSKKDPSFGKKLAQEILNLVRGSNDNYFLRRNEIIRLNETFALGTQDMREYLDLLNIDGKESFVNLDMTPPDIASTFIERIVARCMERDERPTVRCTDEDSLKEKARRKAEAEFRMRMQQEIAAMNEQAGVPMEDPDAFIPEDEDDLELWSESEDKLPAEVAFEKKIYDVLLDSGYQIFKRRVLNDLCIAGYAVAKVYLDSNKHIKYRFIDTQTMLYSYSEFDDFRDSTIIGHVERMKVSDFRQMYPSVDEKQVYKMFQSTPVGTGIRNLEWDDSYYYDSYRPYDDAVIELFFFEYITTDSLSYVKKTTAKGREIVKEGNSGKGELISKRISVVYDGCYCIGTNEMVHWGRKENMIKPMQAIHEVFSSYVIMMPNQRKMISKPLVSKMVRHIRQMTMTLLKLQQLKSQLRPDEIAVDVTGLQEMDLGLGRSMTPFDIQKIFQQTGVMYYKGKSDDDETRNGSPITPMQMSSTPAKMQILMEEYNFNLQMLRNDIGTNEVADGQGFNSKLGLGVQNNLIGTSNRSTEFIYEAFVNLLEGIAKRVAVLMWHSVVGGGPYSEGMVPDPVIRRVFDVQISMLPTDQERQYIQDITTTALGQGLITYEEAFKVRRLSKMNVKLAELYLAKYERKRQEQQRAAQMENIQATAKAQQDSNQQTHTNAMELEQYKGETEKKKQQYIGMADRTKQMGEIVKIMLENPQAASLMGTSAQELVAKYLQNLGATQETEIMDSQVEQQKIVEQQQAKAVEEMAAQEQAQQEQFLAQQNMQ